MSSEFRIFSTYHFQFLTFGHSGAECQSARMSEAENGRLGLYGIS